MYNGLEILGISFAVGGIISSLIGILLRLIDPLKRKKKAELLLCLATAAMLWHVFMYLLIMTGWILWVPNLYNKGIPFYYLIAPSAYLATRYTLNPREKFPPWVWLHAIPFFLALIDNIPYAIATAQEKQQLLELIVRDMQRGYTHTYGFINQKWHYIIKFLLAFGYLMAQWQLLYSHDNTAPKAAKRRWQYSLAFTACYSPHLLLQGSVILSIWFNMEQGSNIIRDPGKVIWVSIFYLTFGLWFFITGSAKTCPRPSKATLGTLKNEKEI